MIMDRIFYNDYINKIVLVNESNIDYSRLTNKDLKKILSYYTTLSSKYTRFDSGIISEFEFLGDAVLEIIISEFLYDVTEAIGKCNLTTIQSRRLSSWLLGYTESEIAEMEGVSRWVVSKSINASTKKILSILKN